MQQHQLRVVQEADELDAKLKALTAFMGGEVYTSLDSMERVLLWSQSVAMATYLGVLKQRIARF